MIGIIVEAAALLDGLGVSFVHYEEDYRKKTFFAFIIGLIRLRSSRKTAVEMQKQVSSVRGKPRLTALVTISQSIYSECVRGWESVLFTPHELG